jgi:8-oxo-dGTP pyrophosphatase MutT (NUDIX family)
LHRTCQRDVTAVIYDEAIRRLEQGLAVLPGARAHERLAPRPRRQWPPDFNPARIRQAAGLLLVFGAAAAPGDEAHIVLTVRSDSVRHGGQVSLPGGVVDPGETFEQAALREAQEEVGLEPAGVRLLGQLTPLDIPVSGFRLHPVVAAHEGRPTLRPSDGEVARILEVDLESLMAPSCLTETERQRDGRTLHVPAFCLAGVEIWGATAMILAEFLTVLGWPRSES